MNIEKNDVLFALFLLLKYLIGGKNALLCELPARCQYRELHVMDAPWNREHISLSSQNGIECDINDGLYEFDFDKWWAFIEPDLDDGKCGLLEESKTTKTVLIDFKSSFYKSIIIDRILNIKNVVRFLYHTSSKYTFRLTNAKGFGVDLFEWDEKLRDRAKYISEIELINPRLYFYLNKKLVKSCQDLVSSNLTTPRSIFQLRSPDTCLYNLLLQNSIYQDSLCPLIFRDAYIYRLLLRGLLKSFYKTNVLSFSQDYFGQEINSQIRAVIIYSSYNIDLDMNFLNPSVFKTINELYIMDQIRSIDSNLFGYFKLFFYLEIEARYTKRLMHKGIDWIKGWNKHIRVDFNDSQSIYDYFGHRRYIKVRFYEYQTLIDVFPDEDFCIYKDYPFQQLVILVQRNTDSEDSIRTDFTCTFLWLVQYYPKVVNYFSDDEIYWDWESRLVVRVTINKLNKSTTYCDFNRLIRLCDKENYQIKEIWDEKDVYTHSQKTIVAIIILTYIISLFGIVSNAIVVWIISSKKTAEMFKEIKLYLYLRLISIFYVIILVIQLLSWISECSNTYDVFCPEIRKFVAMQFFKVIFKESIVTALRFMCNFAYFAFSLSRLSLIGKNHGSIVAFISTVHPIKYTIVTALISIGLSIVKGFRFKVNYDHSELSYPIRYELDIKYESSWQKDAYFIVNLICDCLNYLVFVLIHMSIDIYMVIQLRRTLNEKLMKLKEQINANKFQAKLKENEDSVSKAVKMVIVNSVLSILFKVPLSFMPCLNFISLFYYKSSVSSYDVSQFDAFISYIYHSGLDNLILYISDFLFTLLIFIQLFIYLVFDKNIRLGFDLVFNINKTKIINNDKNFKKY